MPSRQSVKVASCSSQLAVSASPYALHARLALVAQLSQGSNKGAHSAAKVPVKMQPSTHSVGVTSLGHIAPATAWQNAVHGPRRSSDDTPPAPAASLCPPSPDPPFVPEVPPLPPDGPLPRDVESSPHSTQRTRQATKIGTRIAYFVIVP